VSNQALVPRHVLVGDDGGLGDARQGARRQGRKSPYSA
jgi:hypothetical protein